MGFEPHADPLQQPRRTLIVTAHPRKHAVETEPVETEVERSPNGLRPIALPLIGGIENEPELRLPGGRVGPAQRHLPDQDAVAPPRHRERKSVARTVQTALLRHRFERSFDLDAISGLPVQISLNFGQTIVRRNSIQIGPVKRPQGQTLSLDGQIYTHDCRTSPLHR